MGRTLHYSVTNAADITEDEKDVMYAISLGLNSGEFENVWTCENFWLDPYRFYLNWSHPIFHNKEYEACWEALNNEIEKRISQGLKRNAVIQQLCRENMIHLLFPDKICGYCKVGGNEFNAMLVFYWLITISLLTKAEITLHDEGEFLLCPVLIKQGKVKVDMEEIEGTWHCWQKQGFLESNRYGFADKKTRQTQLIRKFPTWSAPQHFCRCVNPDDFMDYPEYGAQQFKAGFEGEYYHLTDPAEVEGESLRLSAEIQKVAKSLGCEIEVGRKIQ